MTDRRYHGNVKHIYQGKTIRQWAIELDCSEAALLRRMHTQGMSFKEAVERPVMKYSSHLTEEEKEERAARRKEYKRKYMKEYHRRCLLYTSDAADE